MSFEQSGKIHLSSSILSNKFLIGVISRPSRPSPNAAPVEIIATNESQTTLSDTHYDRLEAILIEKIQTYVQGGKKILHFKLFIFSSF
jgi:hypothetical protein